MLKTSLQSMSKAERAVAAFGLATAGLLVLATAGSIAWVGHERDRVRQHSREAFAIRSAELLAQAGETLIEHREISALRRLVQEAARLPGIVEARVVLADGTIAADSIAARMDAGLLPEEWSGLGIEGSEVGEAEGVKIARAPIVVPGRGDATLELMLDSSESRFKATDIPLGVAASGACALAGLLLLHRRMASRVRVYTAIGASLTQSLHGETQAEGLVVDEALGDEAKAWNSLVGEREELRKQVLTGRLGGESTGGPARTAVHNACDALWQGLLVIDDRMRVKYANGAASVLLRATPERVLGAEIGAGLLDDRVVEMVRHVAGGETRRRQVVEVERSDESSRSILRFSVRSVRREDHGVALVLIEDITQQKAADEARQSFVAHATHELRTPLTNVKLYVQEAIEAGDEAKAVRQRALNVISQEATRLERIVGDMLCVSEMEAASFKLKTDEVRIAAILDELEEQFGPQASEKSIGLVFERPAKYPVLKGDRDKIALALQNLVGNAIKYTPDGGQVRIKAGAEGGMFRVEISDTGIGIDPGEQELIFERFYRAKDSKVMEQTGTGLGLTLARQVVRLHGGDISVESEKERGSRFTLLLPLMNEAA